MFAGCLFDNSPTPTFLKCLKLGTDTPGLSLPRPRRRKAALFWVATEYTLATSLQWID